MNLSNALVGIPLPEMDMLLVLFGLAFSTFIFGITGMTITYRRGAAAGRPGLTPDELAAAKLRKQQRQDEIKRLRKIKRTGVDLEKKIISHLANAGFAYIYARQGTVAKAAKPKIGHVLFGSDAIWFRIEKLPFRIQYTDLLDPKVSENLTLAIGRECKFISDTQFGLWCQVGLKSGVGGVPKFFAWHDANEQQNALDQLPKSKSFAVAIGLAENRKFVWVDVRNLPHLLVAGATGGGKSVFLNQLLCTLIKNNTPERLQLILIDLKGGLEFDAYESIPHLQRPMIDRPEGIPAALQDVLKEKERRFTMLKGGKVKNIKAWNAQNAVKLPYWFIIFDEIAALMLEPKLKASIETLVSNLSEQGRAVGIHLILCTQYPNKDVLTTRIKANITPRVAFASDDNGSMLVVGNMMAAKLASADGRCIFANGLTRIETQAPFITEKQIADVIAATAVPIETDGITPEEMFDMSLDQYQGIFSTRIMIEAFDGRLTQKTMNDTGRAYEFSFERQGPVIDLPQGRFILAPPVHKRAGRRLMALAGDTLPTCLADIYESDLCFVFGENDGIGDLDGDDLATNGEAARLSGVANEDEEGNEEIHTVSSGDLNNGDDWAGFDEWENRPTAVETGSGSGNDDD